MTPSTFSRHGGSTRGFATSDPERQGVFAGCARSPQPRTAYAPLGSTRAAAPLAHGGSSRTGQGQRPTR